MRKSLKKLFAGATTVVMIASLLVGVQTPQKVAADTVTGTWSFIQGGVYASAQETEWGNVGYINSVTMAGKNEKISSWARGDGSNNQEIAAKDASNGFTIDIENNGWDCQWKDVTGYPTDRINPWTIRAVQKFVAVPGHDYTVTFKAKASQKKYAYFALGSNVEGTGPTGEDLVYDGDKNPAQQILTLGTTEKSYTFKFTNWVSATEITAELMLGAFNAQYDFAGEDVSSIITEVEKNWQGTVIVSDFTIVDEGQNSEFTPLPPAPTTKPSGNNNNNNNNNNNSNNNNNNSSNNNSNVNNSNNNNNGGNAGTVAKKLDKVKGLKAKNSKKGVLKLSWKKVSNAKKYQVKVGKKTYNTSKAKLTVKKLKKGKKYTIKVRATASGYTSSAWASKKVKIKK